MKVKCIEYCNGDSRFDKIPPSFTEGKIYNLNKSFNFLDADDGIQYTHHGYEFGESIFTSFGVIARFEVVED